MKTCAYAFNVKDKDISIQFYHALTSFFFFKLTDQGVIRDIGREGLYTSSIVTSLSSLAILV